MNFNQFPRNQKPLSICVLRKDKLNSSDGDGGPNEKETTVLSYSICPSFVPYNTLMNV